MEDRLSELPDSLIEHILSFLPIKDVVSTWENLWTTLPCLNFTNFDKYEYIEAEIRNFVNRALIFWRGSKLLKFTIEIKNHFDKSLLGGDMDLWVLFAVQNKVEELNIHLMYQKEMMEWEEDVNGSKDEYTAPQCLNLCSSIRKLSLIGCNLRIPASPAWNQLKSLTIDVFYISESMINQIMLGTPQLEEFTLCFMENKVSLNIRSTSLKKLKIRKYYFKQPSLDTVLSIYCPNLETLQCYGVLFGKYLFTNVSSLTDVTIGLYDREYYFACAIKLFGETMRGVLSTLQHVERLTLSGDSYQVLEASMKENLFSPLPNFVFLKLEAFSCQLAKMVHVLEIFPNLEMLAFKDIEFGPSSSEFEIGLSKSILLQLKIIEISPNFNDSSLFRPTEFFLKHCSMLEKMVIRVNRYVSRVRLLEITERLLSMPRSSPTADVIVIRDSFLDGLEFGNILHNFDSGLTF